MNISGYKTPGTYSYSPSLPSEDISPMHFLVVDGVIFHGTHVMNTVRPSLSEFTDQQVSFLL